MATLAATTPTVSARRSFDIPSLDGVRAFSIVLVFLSHTQLNGLVPGGFGVTVFFFLSGYLIATLLRREAQAHGSFSLRKFYLRRVLRIFPPMYTAIALGLVLSLAGLPHDQLHPLGLASQFLFFTNYYMIFAPHNQGIIQSLSSLWSLAVEEHFYLLFPLTYLLIRKLTLRPSRQAMIMGVLWLAISAWRCALVWLWPFSDVQRASLASDTRLDSILIGCMLAVCENPAMDDSILSRSSWQKLLVGAAGLLMISFFLPGIRLRESIRYSMQNWGLVPVFVCAVRYPHWPIFRWLNFRWVRFLGVLSYSLYLVHIPILDACQVLMGTNPLQAVLAAALSVLVSLLIYVGIEKPCAALRKRLA